ncbi:Rid family hydrolase [Alphaproteobacteria bacterium]|nr:Rid family hydrolase [Alphaproteobacteria bacterium]
MRKQSITLVSNEMRAIAGLAESGTPAAFCDAVRVELADAILIYISGATPIDDSGKLVGDTMLEQTRQVLRRIKRVLDDQGAEFGDIVRVRVFVTDISPQALQQVHQARNEVFPPHTRPASTLVQISGIIREGGKIEIEADVVMPKSSMEEDRDD